MANTDSDTKEEGELSDDDDVDFPCEKHPNIERKSNEQQLHEDRTHCSTRRLHRQQEHFPIHENYRHSVYENWSESQIRPGSHTRHIMDDPYYDGYVPHLGPPPSVPSRPLTYDRIRVSAQNHPVHMSDRDRKDFRQFRERMRKHSTPSCSENQNRNINDRYAAPKNYTSPGCILFP